MHFFFSYYEFLYKEFYFIDIKEEMKISIKFLTIILNTNCKNCKKSFDHLYAAQRYTENKNFSATRPNEILINYSQHRTHKHTICIKASFRLSLRLILDFELHGVTRNGITTVF